MIQSKGGLTTHSTGARVSDPFIVELAVAQLCARPVNSGDRPQRSMSGVKLNARLVSTASPSELELTESAAVYQLIQPDPAIASLSSLSSLIMLKAARAGRVNSGDRRAAIKVENYESVVGWIRQPVKRRLKVEHRLRSICSFNPTAHSAALSNVKLGGGLIRALCLRFAFTQ
jgi:hypothetical protein